MNAIYLNYGKRFEDIVDYRNKYTTQAAVKFKPEKTSGLNGIVEM